MKRGLSGNKSVCARFMCVLALGTLLVSGAHTTHGVPKVDTNPEKLKIVFLMGQSNMVGYSRPGTAWYLTQPMYVPPPRTATAKSRYYNSGYFYWSGLLFAQGDSEAYNARGKELYEQRRASRKLWRRRAYGNLGSNAKENNWNTEEWGPAPKLGRSHMYPFLDKKAEEEGIYKRMKEHIESPENKLHPEAALAKLGKRDDAIADDIERVRKLFLDGTKPEDFDGLGEAIEDFGKITESNRLAYAELVREKINLPIAERTTITAIGEVTGGEADGRLSLGYTKWADACGPEYPFGISFEQMVDGPVLIVKSAVGGTSLTSAWRSPSLANDEKGVGPLYAKTIEHIKNVLADPGKYHPDYDPEAGYELAGMVWFQGWNDMNNEKYGDMLVRFIKDFRKDVKASPDMPVVCGLLGHSGWEISTFKGNVNSGMLYASKHPDLKGTVDIVNTLPYMPIELGMWKSVKTAYGPESEEYKEAKRIIDRATCKDGTHYFGSAKFIYLTGDAMARKLANLMAGGEPTIFEEAKAILGSRE